MESFRPGLNALIFLIFGISSLFVGAYFKTKPNPSQNKKLLLKELLEGFGLDLPDELKSLEQAFLKSNKPN